MKLRLLFPVCLLLIIAACSKSDSIPVTCDVRGTYSGTSQKGTTTSPMVYILKENNMTTGSVTLGGPTTTYGGYRNTCDSVIISSWYSSNNNYYLLKGKLSTDKKTISGAYQNLDVPADNGTFSIAKP